MTDRIALEERLAHLSRALDELSDVVARQAAEVDALARRVALLTHREAEREAAEGASIQIADRPPPHW